MPLRIQYTWHFMHMQNVDDPSRDPALDPLIVVLYTASDSHLVTLKQARVTVG